MAKDGTNRGGARPGAGRKKKNPDGTMENSARATTQINNHIITAKRPRFRTSVLIIDNNKNFSE